jgi:trypsin/PEP-CTERM motif-containing protein
MKNLISKLFFGRDTAGSATTVQRCIGVLILMYMVVPAQSLQAIVTSDDPPPPGGSQGLFAHVVTPGSDPYGMNHDGVARLFLYQDGGGTSNFWASGSRLAGTNYILTAAHVVDEFLDPALAVFDQVRADFNGINDNTPVGAELTPGSFKRHPDWNGDVFNGYDVALIKMSTIPGNIPGYNISTADPLGRLSVLAGYGFHGYGEFGQSGTGGEQFLRTGTNVFETNPGAGINLNITNADTQIAYDFEEPGNNDTSFYNHFPELPARSDEVSFADWDSGGPSFKPGVSTSKPLIVGVHSYVQDDLSTDVNAGIKASWGDVGVDAWVGKFDIWDWIVSEAFVASGFHNEIDPLIPSTTEMDNPLNWHNDILPDSSRGAVIQWGGTYTVYGPSQSRSSLTFRDLILGGEEGIKTLSFNGGGSFSVVDHITLAQNAIFNHEVGNVTAPNLIVGSEYGASRAQYRWTDVNGLGASSLTVAQITVGPGGDFIHDWANWNTGTLSAPGGGNVDLDVQVGGRAFLQWNTAGLGDITNAGVLSLGEYAYGNRVLADSLTQTSDGLFGIHYVGDDPTYGLYADWMSVSGQADLAGQLNLIMLGTAIPAFGESDTILTYGSLVGTFDTVEGLNLGNGTMLALSYGATALTVSVVLSGDLNGDGFVGIADLNIVLGGWNQSVAAGVGLGGDPTGDGFVGIADLNLVLGNWNASAPPAGNLSAIPEPGTLGLLGVGLGALLGRRRGGRYVKDQSGDRTSVRSMAMRGRIRIAAALLAAVVLSSTQAGASITLDFLPVDNSALLTGYTTYDMQVTTDADWTSAVMLMELDTGSLYQHAQGFDGLSDPILIPLIYPQYPEMVFDTYVTGSIAGGAGDLDRDAVFTFDTARLDVSWFNLTKTDIGTTTIGRLTTTDDAAGDLQIRLLTGDNQEAEYDVAFVPGAGPVVTEVIKEVVEPEPDDIPYATAYTSPVLTDWTRPEYGTFRSYFGWPINDALRSYPEPYRCPTWDDYSAVDQTAITTINTDRRARNTDFYDGHVNTFFSMADDEGPTDPISTQEESLPEPGTLLLAGACLGAAVLRRRSWSA